jgi:hypothetical protein
VDTAGRQYVAHWMDDFGAGYSIPPGTGTARGDTILIDFAYPEHPFHDTFTYNASTNTWHWLLESAESAGRRTVFAEYDLRRKRR